MQDLDLSAADAGALFEVAEVGLHRTDPQRPVGDLPACHSYGARTVPRDRFDYSSAVGTSWKQQMLLNIVKMRYGEPPVFMEVASVITPIRRNRFLPSPPEFIDRSVEVDRSESRKTLSRAAGDRPQDTTI